MRIGCLQFAPQVGDVNNNLNRADAVLSKANPEDLDLLVLPELAFSGYNFKSLQHISPYLEPTTAGITSLWARTTALKYDCVVTAGYPEKVDITPKWPASPEYYNSAITVNADGETIANYRKSFLYYADETWALEGPDGFYDGEINGLGNVAMGICMDLNPYKFEAPWSAWEFAYHILHKQANLVIISMAWLTREDSRAFSRTPKEPDMETLSYWLARLEPLIRAEGDDEIIVVLANRCGTEDEAVYAGTSTVLGIQSGEVKVYGILGRGERELLVVDTTRPPQAKLISEPTSAGSHSKRNSRNANSNSNQPASSKTLSSKSAKPVQAAPAKLNVSIGTNGTKAVSPLISPSPPTPDAMDLIEDMIVPLSPVDARNPSSFFARPGDPEVREPHPGSLISSIEKVKQIDATQLDSPTFFRPLTPTSHDSSQSKQYVDPGLVSPDLGQTPNMPSRTFGVGAPLNISSAGPHSASVIPDQCVDQFPGKGAAMKSPTSPRPKSVLW